MAELTISWTREFWHEEADSCESHEDTFHIAQEQMEDLLKNLPQGRYRLIIESVNVLVEP